MSADPPIAPAFVDSTLTLVFSLDVRALGLVTLQVQNLDATQVCEGYVRRRVAQGLTSAVSSLPDFVAIQPAGSVDAAGNPTDTVTCDIDAAGSALLEFAARMSGAGGNIQYSFRKAGPKP